MLCVSTVCDGTILKEMCIVGLESTKKICIATKTSELFNPKKECKGKNRRVSYIGLHSEILLFV